MFISVANFLSQTRNTRLGLGRSWKVGKTWVDRIESSFETVSRVTNAGAQGLGFSWHWQRKFWLTCWYFMLLVFVSWRWGALWRDMYSFNNFIVFMLHTLCINWPSLVTGTQSLYWVQFLSPLAYKLYSSKHYYKIIITNQRQILRILWSIISFSSIYNWHQICKSHGQFNIKILNFNRDRYYIIITIN